MKGVNVTRTAQVMAHPVTRGTISHPPSQPPPSNQGSPWIEAGIWFGVFVIVLVALREAKRKWPGLFWPGVYIGLVAMDAVIATAFPPAYTLARAVVVLIGFVFLAYEVKAISTDREQQDARFLQQDRRAEEVSGGLTELKDAIQEHFKVVETDPQQVETAKERQVEADQQPQGLAKEAFALSSELIRFLADFRPFDPSADPPITSLLPSSAAADRAPQLVEIQRDLSIHRFEWQLIQLYDKRFRSRISELRGKFIEAHATEQSPDPLHDQLYLNPLSYKDIELVAEQVYVLARRAAGQIVPYVGPAPR